jgi:hypothetical protein
MPFKWVPPTLRGQLPRPPIDQPVAFHYAQCRAVTAPYKSTIAKGRSVLTPIVGPDPMPVARRLEVWVNPHPGEIRQRHDALHSAIAWSAPVRSPKPLLLKSMIKGNLASAASWPAPVHGSRIVRIDIFIAVRAAQSYPQTTSSDLAQIILVSGPSRGLANAQRCSIGPRACNERLPCVFCAHGPIGVLPQTPINQLHIVPELRALG